VRWRGLCYRAHDPKWAWAPASGAGAAAKGGRFNPVGVPALYLALTPEGMILEMGHGFAHRFEPLTVVTYEVDVEGIADLRTEADRAAEGITLNDLSCAWALDRVENRVPASWTVHRRLTAKGYGGILVPSFARGARTDMANLVLWDWGQVPPRAVIAFDPNGKLPKDQSSW
jgi:RES domain-containing protein